MELYKKKVKSAANYLLTFIKWVIIAGAIGLLSGIVGTLFYKSVEIATGFRIEHEWIIWLLPIGGLVIVGLYKLCKMSAGTGTDRIFDSIRSDEEVPVAMAPLIFASTVITHLFGGSAGREGAALQLGGSIGYQIGKILHLDEKDMHLATLCGMSSLFSALFGTPLTATFFSMEVISVGIIYYSGIIPCIFSSFISYGVSLLFGVKPVHFSIKVIPELNFLVMLKTVVLAAFCAVISIIFCVGMRKTNSLMSKLWKNEYIRIIIGGFAIIGLTLAVGSRDYNGAGMDIIEKAMSGETKPEAFMLKMIFTVITISAGFKGGEIVPTFFIGSTFGCIMGGLIGLDPGFGAAIGLTALFCGVVNSPISSIFLSIELFGSGGLPLFAVACGVSNMLSGYYGIYSSQKIIYSKLKAEYINIYAK